MKKMDHRDPIIIPVLLGRKNSATWVKVLLVEAWSHLRELNPRRVQRNFGKGNVMSTMSWASPSGTATHWGLVFGVSLLVGIVLFWTRTLIASANPKLFRIFCRRTPTCTHILRPWLDSQVKSGGPTLSFMGIPSTGVWFLFANAPRVV